MLQSLVQSVCVCGHTYTIPSLTLLLRWSGVYWVGAGVRVCDVFRFCFFCRTFRATSLSSSCELFTSSSFSLLWVLELLCVARSSRWGKRDITWPSGDIYAVLSSLLQMPHSFCAFNSLLKQGPRFLHLAWISFPKRNGKITTIHYFQLNSYFLNFSNWFEF